MDRAPDSIPYLTADLPGIGGRIKERPADFQVEEIPRYEPCGEGTHTYFAIEKQGLSTLRAVRAVAGALGVAPRTVGYAGLKDAQAVTRQTFSVADVDPAVVDALALPRIKILWVRRHGNKLKLGHLRGNRFVIKLRGADTARLDAARSVLDVLARRGMPNYYGPQRFGRRGDTGRIGLAMIRQDWTEAIDLFLGRPGPTDAGDVLAARQQYDAGDFVAADRAWPPAFRDERRAGHVLAETGGDHKRAAFAIDGTLRRLFLSAGQSELFNAVVTARLADLDRLLTGDLAWKHVNGACFLVDDAAVEQPRCDDFEISPTGPLFGFRMTPPRGEPSEIEARIFAESGLTRGDFLGRGLHRIKGARRPLRVPLADLALNADRDDDGDYVELRFTLPPGSYATVLLREVCKTPAIDAVRVRDLGEDAGHTAIITSPTRDAP